MYDFVYYVFVLNDSLNAAFLLDKLSSAWVKPIYSINCRVNGTEAHTLNRLSIE